MIKRFFQGLNSLGVSYLLISGQATVLYGASTFSEDIDLWVKPEIKNWNNLLRLLRDIGARIYKLTPPISIKFIKKGHGYHFQLLSKDTRQPIWFLDVMGRVPRVRDFDRCYKDATHQMTDWGNLPIIGIMDLVELKKTRRLEDYSIISKLVRIEYENLLPTKINPTHWRWILSNSFEIDDIMYYLENHPLARDIGRSIRRECISDCLKAIENPHQRQRYIKSASRKNILEIESLREKDRQYWRPIINELKVLNNKNQLYQSGDIPPDSVG